MAQETGNKFLMGVIPVAASAMGEDEVAAFFTKNVSSNFGIEKVNLIDLKKRIGENALEGYIKNTKKAVIDNQLSEFSAFPELIDYKNRGYKSCAILPLVADGKVVSLLEMLSASENKFSDDVVGNISLGASFISFVLMYKGELNRSVRLATYFDAAFDNQFPQLIVSEDGSVVKFNKSAIKELDLVVPETRRISELVGMDFKKLVSFAGAQQRAAVTMTRGRNTNRVYALVVSKINDKLIHIAANDVTDAFGYNSLNELLTKNTDVVVLLTDANFTIKNISSNAEAVFGYSKSVLSNSNLVDIAAQNERDTFEKNITESASKDLTTSGAVTIALDKMNKYFHYYARKFINGYMFLLVSSDVERFMQNTKSDLEDFIGSTSDAVFGVDALGYVKDCNLQAANILGYSKQELIGREIKSFYHEQDLLDRDINYVRNGKPIDRTSVTLIGRESKPIRAWHSIRVLHGGSSENGVEYLIILHELETKSRLDEQRGALERQEGIIKRLQSDSALKSQFIHNISHELKTPLTNIKGFSKLLMDGEFGQLNEEQRQYLDTIIAEADRQLLVIQQVLEAAKLEADKVKLEYKDVDLKGMGNNPTIKSLEESARGKGLEFEWKPDWDVPEKISADPNRLIQIFVNLIGNAVKFTEKGKITVRISRQGKYVRCSIMDTGIGMVEEDRGRLFRRKFYEATKKGLVQQPGAGTGLGLSITHDLVKLHGGKIKAESRIGEGSTFWFTLPIAKKMKRKKAGEAQAPPIEQKT